MKWNILAQRASHAILIALISACAFRPYLTTDDNKTEDQSAIKLVSLGPNSFTIADTAESREIARQKLLTEIKAECSHPRFLAEGASVEPQLTATTVQEKTISAPEPARYYWIRYECEGL